MSLNFVNCCEVIRSEKFTLTRKSSWTEACNVIKLTDVFRVNGIKVSADICPAGMSLRPNLTSELSSKFQHGIHAAATIPCTYFSPMCARKLPQIKFGTSFRLNAIARTCANFREIRKSGEVIRHNLSLLFLLCCAYFLIKL